MGIEQAREHLKRWNRQDDILEYRASSATVALAARALGVEEARIAKSLSFKRGDRPLLVVTAGDVRVDNRKYKTRFGCKAKMMQPAEVSETIGHEVGGVCPFGTRDGVEIYLDSSLKRFTTVFPACGSANSAIELSCAELEDISGASGWVDICTSC
ncbi:MAG: YbaK/EbsC family protein [Desulfopila sp.]